MATATNVTTAVPPWVVVEEPRRTGGGETPRLGFQTPPPTQCGRSRKSSRRSAGALPASSAGFRPGRLGGPGEVGLTRSRPTGPGCGNLGGSRDGSWDWLKRGGGTGDSRRLARFDREAARRGPRKFLPKRLKKIDCVFRSVILIVRDRSVAGRSALLADFRYVNNSCPLHPYMV